jgi:hypothetical protein
MLLKNGTQLTGNLRKNGLQRRCGIYAGSTRVQPDHGEDSSQRPTATAGNKRLVPAK